MRMDYVFSLLDRLLGVEPATHLCSIIPYCECTDYVGDPMCGSTIVCCDRYICPDGSQFTRNCIPTGQCCG